MLDQSQLASLFNSNRISISAEQAKTICDYRSILLEWNKKINLISRADTANFDYVHLLDCALPVNMLPEFNLAVDLGTGGGLPGIVLAILFPERRFVLSDTKQKKLKFLHTAVTNLNLNNVTLFNAAQEKFREQADLLVTRAFGSLAKINKLAGNYLKTGGRVAAYKGTAERVTLERSELDKSITMEQINYRLNLPDHSSMERTLILFQPSF